VLLALTQTDLVSETIGILTLASPLWYAFGLLLYVGGLLVTVLRGQIFVRALGYDIPYGTLAVDTLKSTGLNAAFAMGAGEVFRVGRLRSEGMGLVEAGSVVIIDRGVGLVSVASAGLVSAAIYGAEVTGSLPSLPVLLALLVAGGGIALLAGRHAIGRWAPAILPIFQDWRRSIGLLACSLTILLLWIGSVAAFAKGLSLPVDFGVIAFAAPLVTLATLVPISIGGVGVREVGYALLLAPYGVTSSQAVALGATQYSGFILVAAAAWLLLMLDRGAVAGSGLEQAEGEARVTRSVEPEHDLPAPDEGPEPFRVPQRGSHVGVLEARRRLQEIGQAGASGGSAEARLDDRRS
jgi:uncharacterized membrane protein YbhN (UPF0104 family)